MTISSEQLDNIMRLYLKQSNKGNWGIFTYQWNPYTFTEYPKCACVDCTGHKTKVKRLVLQLHALFLHQSKETVLLWAKEHNILEYLNVVPER